MIFKRNSGNKLQELSFCESPVKEIQFIIFKIKSLAIEV